MSRSNKKTELRTNLHDVWSDYGGWPTLRASGYLTLSLFLTVGLWRDFAEGKWADISVAIVPPILGLTLAAAAILTSIGGDDFRQRLAEVGSEDGALAPIIQRLSSFIFAMAVQLVSLLYAIIFRAKPFSANWLDIINIRPEAAFWINAVFGAFGCLLLIYGAVLILGAAFSIRALAVVYVRDARREAQRRLQPIQTDRPAVEGHDTESPSRPRTPQHQ